VGLLLRTPIFSHGQLYVALSRARTKAGVKIWQPKEEGKKDADDKTRTETDTIEVQNLVYTSVLN